MPPESIDLNCDLGESFGAYTIGMDTEIMPHITSANIACGWHAGDPMVMDRTVALAKTHAISCGSHPGYPDRQGFGRRSLTMTVEETRNLIIYQVGALQAFCASHGLRLQYVKPHGALYNTAVDETAIAQALITAIVSVDPSMALFVLAGSAGDKQASLAMDAGLRVVREAFPDRSYTRQGTLVPRSQPNAVIRDPSHVADRALQIATAGSIDSEDGQVIPLNAQTLCVHGDTPQAVSQARQIRQSLESNGVVLAPAVRQATASVPASNRCAS